MDVGSTTSWILPGLYCRDLVVVLVKYFEDGAERRLADCSAYLQYDSEDSPKTKLENFVRYCEKEHLCVIIESESRHTN
jgi:hypothetical protein